MIKPIETIYKGYKFRSRLEARWAVFFDACGVSWEYEPEGFDLGGGLYYLPDFLLHDVKLRHDPHAELYVEVKGQMTDEDKAKILAFAEPYDDHPLLVVGNIPFGKDIHDRISNINEQTYDNQLLFSFELIDADVFPAYPCIDFNQRFTLLAPDGEDSYYNSMDFDQTNQAYQKAQQARFEHGETGE